ncbi:MAG: T9SS type A sorting domain-containing protein, partial [Flavobacteriales bacterium]
MVASNVIKRIVFLLFVLGPSMLNAQGLQWLKHISGTFDEQVSTVTTDSTGNVYVTGSLAAWNGPGGFVDGNFHAIAGTRDIFLAKFNASGDYQWSVTAGGDKIPVDINERESGYMVKYNSTTNTVVLLGSYDSNSSYFGPGLTASGKGMFLAGYSVDGVCLWLETVPWGEGTSIAIDDHGVIYVQGNREELFSDRFIRKYSGNGDLIHYAEIGVDVRGLLETKNDSVVIMAGWCRNEPEFLGTSLLPVTTARNPLLARIDSSLQTALNINQFRSSGLSLFGSVTQFNQSLITTGVFEDSLFFGNDTLTAAPGTYQPFIAKHTNTGEPIWIEWFGASGNHYAVPRAIVASDSTIYASFTIASSVTLGSFTVTPNAAQDFVVARFDQLGNCLGVIHGGEVYGPHVDIVSTNDGGIVICGLFENTLQLGNGLVSKGSKDGFVAKFNAITGIQSFGDLGNNQLHIYANPNNGICTVDLPSSINPGSDLMLTIYNAQGQVVQQAPLLVSNGTVQLDIQAQAKGVYMVELLDGAQRYSGTIV